jgi:hypothetical protein
MKLAQRKEKELGRMQVAATLPQMKAIIDVATRVAYSVVMIRRAVLLYKSMLLLRNTAEAGTEFVTAFDKVASSWSLLCEMEAVCSYVADLSLSKVQREYPSASFVLVFRSQILESLNAATFSVMNHEADITAATRECNFPRREKALGDFSNGGKVCQLRLLNQVIAKFPNLDACLCCGMFTTMHTTPVLT